ncbi:uncharacterized protein LOC126835599 isoform X2 [Adelges cooleyi]|uniref:uncharacterized protein LOC126835599 isoform X2 n=1 Tax=Adelges cooleyi TaxID=133065 RepID=UPI00217FA278|nr:uncharacterized protein LOC126835599 isoform X2 [Adelges cooleyi]
MKTFCIIILFASVNVLLAVLDYTTKQIILTNKYIDLAEEKIAVMLAVPEAVNDDPKPNRILRLQGNMRTEIRKALGCPHSSLIDINETDFQGVTIRDLGRARRRKTREAIITLIRELIRDNSSRFPDFENLPIMCPLIGLFRSVSYPDSYTKSCIYHEGTCNLLSIHNDISMYRSFNGVFWEININNELLRPLADQLLDNLDQ